jgi:hypothetical protein
MTMAANVADITELPNLLRDSDIRYCLVTPVTAVMSTNVALDMLPSRFMTNENSAIGYNPTRESATVNSSLFVLA